MKDMFKNLRRFFRRNFRTTGFSPAPAFILVFILSTVSAFAVGGGVDPTFNAGITNFNTQSVETIAVQPDGRILIGGSFEVAGGIRRNRIARLNADGTLDPSFNPPGGADNTVFAVAPQPDGKILIGGNFTNVNGTGRNFIARLNADGTLDPEFAASGINSSVFAILVQPDGKIVIGGAFISGGNSRVRRLNPDGSLDTAFAANVGAGANGGPVRALALQPDGKILLGGSFTSINTTPANRAARLNADGSPDASFNMAVGANRDVETIAVQPDGKILLGGSFNSFNGASVNRLARLEPSGAVDSSFDVGTGASNTVSQVVLLPDGRLLIGGTFHTFNGLTRRGVARVNTDGSLDQNFSSPFSTSETPPVETLAVQLTGEILIGGGFFTVGGNFRTALAQADVTGALDAEFLPVIGEVGRTDLLLVEPDGKLVVAGVFLGVNDKINRRIARLNADGTLDTTFRTGTGANGNISALARQPDGKIVLGGAFTNFNGVARQNLARLNPDGSLDAGFTPSLNSIVNKIIVQPDGKILLAGSFTAVNNDPTRRYAAQLNPDGSLDTAFAANNYSSGIETAARQSDGKIVISGFFNSINGTPAARFARLNADGSHDPSFDTGTATNGGASSLLVLASGKILACGSFTQINGVNRPQIARLNTDGSVDATFTPGTGANSTISSVAEQADGRLVIGGAFTNYNGVSRVRIARLNPDGPLDVSFNPGTGADGAVFAVALSADGRVLLGGNFGAIDNISRIGIARLLAGSTTVWTGAVDGNYHNPANWSDNVVPAAADSAEIRAETKHAPIVTVPVGLTSLEIDEGADLTIASGATLTLQGLGNNGNLFGGGKLVLNGTTFVNNGVVATREVDFTGRGLKSLGGTGSFYDNVLTVENGVNLRLDSDHVFNRVVVAAGAQFNIASRILRLRAGGEALSVSGSLTDHFSTVIYAASQPQLTRLSHFANLTINNPAGVSLAGPAQIHGTLELAAGILTTNGHSLALDDSAEAVRTGGYVVGKMQKSLSGGRSFTFFVGTSGGYSPVSVANVEGTGTFAVEAGEGFLAGVDPARSIGQNWSLTAAGITRADLAFQYPDSSVPAGANESDFRFVRRSGATNREFAPSSFDVSTNIFTLGGVTQFSDWTLGRNLAPTAAGVMIGGRVTSARGGVSGARIALTDAAGETRYALTNSFGFYSFANVPAGQTYVLSASCKQYVFDPPTRLLTVDDHLADADFTAREEGRRF